VHFSAPTCFPIVARLTGACIFVIKSLLGGVSSSLQAFCRCSLDKKLSTAQRFGCRYSQKLIQELKQTLILPTALKMSIKLFHKFQIISKWLDVGSFGSPSCKLQDFFNLTNKVELIKLSLSPFLLLTLDSKS
jgi:hypothetical protein